MPTLCLWNFYGPRSKEIAAHFLEHTHEFLSKNNAQAQTSEVKGINANHHIATLTIDSHLDILIQKSLKPHQMSPLEA